MNRARIENEVLAWMEESPWKTDPARFERLALALFRFQFAHCEPYARFCRSLERTPAKVTRIEEIPAVPTGAFKEFDLRSFDPVTTIKTFRTSGTSSDRRGRLHLDTLRLYETSLLASLGMTLLDDPPDREPILRFLAPPPEEVPDSSLTHMFATLLGRRGGPESGFDLRAGALDLDGIADAIANARRVDRPIVLLGTSFAFVHLLDATAETEGDVWRLPPDSRVMETGGFKGRSREIPPDALRTELAGRFGIPETSIVNQYGMTELGSQFYDSTWIDPSGPRRKLVPPWTRIRVIDPATGEDAPAGEVGLIVVHDLANTGSVAAIETADLGRSLRDADGEAIGFEILGRFEGAEARGCSIATDVMLAASQDGDPR